MQYIHMDFYYAAPLQPASATRRKAGTCYVTCFKSGDASVCRILLAFQLFGTASRNVSLKQGPRRGEHCRDTTTLIMLLAPVREGRCALAQAIALSTGVVTIP